MGENLKKQVFCLFQNKRFQLHDSDGSILQCKHDNMLYISSKGVKGTLRLEQLPKIPDLQHKYNKCIDKINTYGVQHQYLLTNIDNEDKLVRMGCKLEEFRWDNPQIQEQKDGYSLKSDCKFAKLKLLHNLYIVEVSYLQLVRDSNTHAARAPNMTKLLLQKYNHSYSEFPTLPLPQAQPQYHYLPHAKTLTIFTMPPQWVYPLHLIHASLLAHRIIPHQFMYMHYDENELAKTTPMPRLISSGKFMGEGQEGTTLPVLGTLNHGDACLWAGVGDFGAWWWRGGGVGWDRLGFWFWDQAKVKYRRVNRPEFEHEYHYKALPFTVRHSDEPSRNIKFELHLFMSYSEENRRLQSLMPCSRPTVEFDNENTLVHQQSSPEAGSFGAYSNGTIICRYPDRALLTINSKKMQGKLITTTGESLLIDLQNPEGVNFTHNRQYILPGLDFQERVFYPQYWLHKQQAKEEVENLVQLSEMFQKTNELILKL